MCTVRCVGRPFAVFVLIGVLVGCGDGDTPDSRPTSQFSAAVAMRWSDLHLQLVRQAAGFTPPIASRAFGYLGVTLYEAVLPGMPGHRSMAGLLKGLGSLPRPKLEDEYHWAAAANAALAAQSRNLFPTATSQNLTAIDALEQELGNTFRAETSSAVYDRSVAFGKDLAAAIFAWSQTDGGDAGYSRNFPTDYVPPVGPGLWVPTPPGFQRAMQPYWGNNRPFVLASGLECAPDPPPSYSEDPTSEFYAYGQEVYDTGNTLSDEERAIALFWSDDPGQTATPPGHSISILTQVLTLKGSALDVAATAYAKVGMAVADAFIACWAVKYVENLLRPVTYIQEVIDPNWLPLLNTPPFPEYTSGHSVQSAAAAEVLTALFGAVAFTDHTHDSRGLSPRSFASFREAADEAALSRLYGGIHYLPAIEIGLEQGRCIGAKVDALPIGG